MDDFSDTDVGHAIAFMFITIEESVDVAETTQDVQFVDSDSLEGGRVEEKRADRTEILAGINDVGVVESERDYRV